MSTESSSPERSLRSWVASELGARIASAVILGIIALLTAYQGGWPFALFWLLGGVAVACEWVAMTRIEPCRTAQIVLALGVSALTTAYLSSIGATGTFVVTAAAVAAALIVVRTGRDRLWIVIGFFCSAVVAMVPPVVRDDPALGIVGLLWMFAVVWSTDIAAYFTGRRLGGPKLWPQVSPKKTWSGFVGGLIAGTTAGAVVTALAARLGWNPVAGMMPVIIISAAASVVSQLGDLAESALKRHFGVKDSSQVIPGHGGVMDRLDGFWAVSVLVGAMLAVAQLARS